MISGALGPEDELARVGGDEFAMLASCASLEEASRMATRLELILTSEGCEVTFGWSAFPHEGDNALALLARETTHADPDALGFVPRPRGSRMDAPKSEVAMVRLGSTALRLSSPFGLALALTVLAGGAVAAGPAGETAGRPERVALPLPAGGEMAYARIVLRRLPFGSTLRTPKLPTLAVENEERLPAAATVVASVAPHNQRGQAIPEFVVDVAVLRPASTVAGTPAGPPGPARSLRLVVTPDRDELGVVTLTTEAAALRRRGSFHGPEPYRFCGANERPRGEPRRIAGPALERFSPAAARRWAYAAACDTPIPGDVAARLGGVAAWGTWSFSRSDATAIAYSVRANRAITGFGLVVPAGSVTRQRPPAGFSCPHVGIDFLDCEGALPAGTTSAEGLIGLTPRPRTSAQGSLFVTVRRVSYGPCRLRFAG